jgi:hypothetical protein
MTRVFVAGLCAGLVASAHVPAARAYDPATTHAALTERAVMASGLHRLLVRRLARPLGLFEPITLYAGELPASLGRELPLRLAALDPGQGYRPDEEGVAPALAWVVAGTVVAQMPAERGGNLFFDPSRGAGLSEGGGLTQFGFTLRELLDEPDGFRAWATGSNFNLTGRPSTEWLMAPENDVGLSAFYDALEASVSAERPAARSTALVRALLALGGTLAVLEDAGEPAHVRNDFREAYLGGESGGPFDRGSRFERFVANQYGRMGVPPAGPPVTRPTLMAFITAADGQGLADRTQRRFFSDGTVPETAFVDRDTTAADVMVDARGSLAYGLPRLPRLELRALGERRYAYAVDSALGKPPARRRLLAYERVPGRVRFFLDDAVYADTARALLPEIGAYGAGLVDHLLRAELALDVAGDTATVAVHGARGGLRKGAIRLYAEDSAGARRLFATVSASESAVSAAIPAGSRRISAALRGEDDAGVVVAVAERPVPTKP